VQAVVLLHQLLGHFLEFGILDDAAAHRAPQPALRFVLGADAFGALERIDEADLAGQIASQIVALLSASAYIPHGDQATGAVLGRVVITGTRSQYRFFE
jgi:hypothetical protein